MNCRILSVVLVFLFLASVSLSSCDKPASEEPAATTTGEETKSTTTKPVADAPSKDTSNSAKAGNNGTIADLTKRLKADKDRIDKDASLPVSKETIQGLETTAAAFFNALIAEDAGSFNGYLLSDEDLERFFPADAAIILGGRKSSNDTARRKLREIIGGLITSHGDVEINGLMEEKGQITARVIKIPFKAGDLSGSVDVMGAAQTPTGWRFSRIVLKQHAKK